MNAAQAAAQVADQLLELGRLAHWDLELARYLRDRRDRPFEWGGNDCASFAIGEIAAIAGRVVWPIAWTNALEAARAIEAAGGLVDAMTATLGRPSQNWRQARRGDVGLVEMQQRDSVVVCTGQTWAGPGIQGLEHVNLSAARLVWAVG